MAADDREQFSGDPRPRSDGQLRAQAQSGEQTPDPDATLALERFEPVTPAGPTLQITGSWAGLIPQDMAGAPKYWTSTHIVSAQAAAADKNDGSADEIVGQQIEDPLLGQVIEDSYEIMGILGRGGMAVVYLAKQLATDRLVAMKSMKINSAEDIMRFGREVRSHSRLQHRNIVEYMEFIATSAGEFFLVMERIKGLNLLDIIRSIGRIDGVDNIGSIMIQSCDALNYAHMSGVIHRDLKTSNIVLVKEGERDDIVVKILDFGIARVEGEERITFQGKAIGSPMYMSPEQCGAKALGPRSDIYSLGVVAYEMLTGKPPYSKGSVRDIMMAHCTPTTMPQPMGEVVPHIPGIKMLDQIVLKSLQTDQAKRWSTAAQMREAFEFWYDAIKSGADIQSLPDEMLEERSAPTVEIEDKDYMLSLKERDQIRHIKRTSSMQISFGPGKLGDIDQERLQKNEEHGSKLMMQNALAHERRRAIRLAVLTACLGASLIAYFTLNFERIANMISPPKPAPAAVTTPAPPAVKTPAKKEPDKKKKKSRSRRNRASSQK